MEKGDEEQKRTWREEMGMERWRGWRSVPSRGGAVGQDTPHGLPATRCPPWPTHGCQGPQKSASVGKSLQDTAGQSPSTLGWERLPRAEQGQGLLPQFHGFGGKMDAWSCRGGSIPGVFYGCNPPGFPMLWERVNPLGLPCSQPWGAVLDQVLRVLLPCSLPILQVPGRVSALRIPSQRCRGSLGL